MNRSVESKYSNELDPFLSDEEIQNTMNKKQMMKIKINELKKSSKIPNIQVKTGMKSAENADGNMKNSVKSKFLQETTSSTNRLKKSKEQIMKNRENAGQPKNFVTGRVSENIFSGFNKKEENSEDENIQILIQPKYQIIPKKKPVKLYSNIYESPKKQSLLAKPRFIEKKGKYKPCRKGTGSVGFRSK